MALPKKRKVDSENRAFNPECTDLYLFIVTAVHSLQRKLDVFKEDLQGDCAHFSVVQNQGQGQGDVSSVDCIDKLIVNFSNCFDSFSFGRQLTMIIEKPFLMTNVRVVKRITRQFKWVNARNPQMQLVDLQTEATLREQFARTDPLAFWL